MKTKKEWKIFTIYECEKEEKYLREMHKKGWKLAKVSGLGVYRFEECAPEDVVYKRDYNTEAEKDKEGYIQLFRDCGWEHVLDYVGFSYFCKKVALINGPEEIVQNDFDKKELMKRIFRGRLISLIVILLVNIPITVVQFMVGNWVTACMCCGLIVLYIVIFANYCRQYHA